MQNRQILMNDSTTVLRAPDGTTVEIPPGTPLECENAAELVERGLARWADEVAADAARVRVDPGSQTETRTDPAPNTGGGNTDAGGGSDTERDDAIVASMIGLDAENTALFTADGRPTVEAVSQAAGFAVNAADRDRLWAVVSST